MLRCCCAQELVAVDLFFVLSRLDGMAETPFMERMER